VVAAELLGKEHLYINMAIQITVGPMNVMVGFQGRTLREACSWGTVSTVYEQMVYAEVTLALSPACFLCLSQRRSKIVLRLMSKKFFND